ncbi:acetate kinase [Arthrobacter agilis]|uniref:acetate/propionate family kinase n=1 Tax=Arthrobacter agilis TaxID=37921 RepID=UPI000B34D120|nr:acetate kinase [Arthrobacter agilis]OUM42423.1 acetate kinase [Arthrobacter agilis]PPB45764.1 acetate kinase [Arthrobacter agilis]TPV26253.1 acetate kinase [Arthrobacter agilis]VDR30899.1 Acetate kinase [Arthrobacter agilis]
MIILVINSGSSSLKYQVREGDDVLAEGLVERIGEAEVPDHAAALDRVDRDVATALGDRGIDAVGHRVVHGGERFSEPVLIDNEITRAIERLNPLAPLHNPAAVTGIRAITDKWPDMPQVAVFDTAFHRTLPERAWRYAVPDELYRKYGIRRYGFHGTSHAYVARGAAELLGEKAFTGVIAHLGNGASVTAVRAGESIDTSMGFTPLEGLVMGTRSGDIDPSILLFLLREGYSEQDLDTLLNRTSGLKGLAGTNDMRSVAEAAASGDDRATLAIEVASYRLAKYIGGYHVAVGGAQALVFTAGIGENAGDFRAAVVSKLGALGLELDEGLNAERSKKARTISTAASAFPVLVVPTDEEAAIAGATADVVRRS